METGDRNQLISWMQQELRAVPLLEKLAPPKPETSVAKPGFATSSQAIAPPMQEMPLPQLTIGVEKPGLATSSQEPPPRYTQSQETVTHSAAKSAETVALRVVSTFSGEHSDHCEYSELRKSVRQ